MKITVSQGNAKFQNIIDKEQRFINHHMGQRTADYYNRVRVNLKNLRHGIDRKYDGIVLSFIEVLKAYQKAAGQLPAESLQNKKHPLSDHAFCMALIRMYGVDLHKVKDRILEDINIYKVRHCVVKGVITTVLGE